MNRIFTFILFLFFTGAAQPAQNQTVAISNLSSCAGQEVLIPVRASNLTDVGAITLFIEFDTMQLQYISLDNIDSQLAAMNYNYLSGPPRIGIAWSNLVAGNFPDTKLFDIRMRVNTAPGNLYFSSSCEISGSNLQVLPVVYSQGIVSSSSPTIITQPASTSVQEGMDAAFSVTSSNTDAFHWKESRDEGATWNYLTDGPLYSGTHSQHLTIHSVPLTFSGYRYACFLSAGMCFTNTTDAELQVDSVLSVATLPAGSGISLFASPNPFSEKVRMNYFLPCDGLVHLEFFNIFGQKIVDVPECQQTSGSHSFIFYQPDLQKGLYLCKLGFTHDNSRKSLILKLIKE